MAHTVNKIHSKICTQIIYIIFLAFLAGKVSTGESSASTSGSRKEVSQKTKITDKWKAAAPFHMFMTKVPNIPGTLDENLSIGLSGKIYYIGYSLMYYRYTFYSLYPEQST